MLYWPIGNSYPVGNLCVSAHDSIVFVGYISKDCVCVGPYATLTSASWTELKWRGETIKVRSLGGSIFEVMKAGEPVLKDTKHIDDRYCEPIPGVS